MNRLDAVDPAELRMIFGANLRRLSASYPSIAGLCRDLGINRTQFNRYLSSESFPRPDVLHRICRFFGVDARILLEPVDILKPISSDLLNHPAISSYLGRGATMVDEETFPSGFYRFSRRSFIESEKFLLGLVFVFREDGYTFIRGFEAKEVMHQQGLPLSSRFREFRGIVLRQEDGLAALVARHESISSSFNFLTRVTSFENNFWEGYVARTTRENISSSRVARLVYEHIHNDRAAIMAAARSAGLCTIDALSPFHRRLLRLDEPFR